MSQTSLARNKLSFANLPEATAHARQLLDGGYSRRGNWTLGQICWHLASTIEMSRRGFHSIKTPPGIFLLRKPALWWVLKFGMPKGVPAPPILVPGDFAEDEKSLARFEDEIGLFSSHQGKLAFSPMFGQLDRPTWERIHAIHAAHHLSFLTPYSATVSQG